jgi:hypothetical protein
MIAVACSSSLVRLSSKIEFEVLVPERDGLSLFSLISVIFFITDLS